MKRKIGAILRKSYLSFEKWREYSNSRSQAAVLRKKVVERRGASFVDSKCKNMIKDYADNRFGSPDFWPWLALYAEIRQEFKEGWIPNDYYIYNLLPKWNPRNIADISAIKSFDHRLFPGFSIEPLAVKISGQYFDQNHNKIELREVKEIVRKYGSEVVIKRDTGPSGKGIIFTDSEDIIDDQITKNENLVIQPSVHQFEELEKLYPHSVNTFRVFTYLDSAGNVTIKAVILRFGVGGSRIDNVMSGGSYLVITGGSVGEISYDGLGFETGNIHPDSGIKFTDLKLPFIHKVKESCREAHLLFPYVRFVGWDVCIDQNGVPRLIEWNAWSPTFWRYEARLGPFWKNTPG